MMKALAWYAYIEQEASTAIEPLKMSFRELGVYYHCFEGRSVVLIVETEIFFVGRDVLMSLFITTSTLFAHQLPGKVGGCERP